MSDRIAFMTLGVLKQPVGSPEVQEFLDRLPATYAEADGSAGFIARSVRNPQTWEHSWGPVIAPKCVPQGLELNQLAMTLSLWQDLESVAKYAYRGLHAEALSKRSEWFERGPWPAYVAYWVPEGHVPDWAEGVERLDHLHANGSHPRAFSFKRPFDAAGQPTKLDRRAFGPVRGAETS